MERLGDAAGKSPAGCDGPDVWNKMGAFDWLHMSLSPTRLRMYFVRTSRRAHKAAEM